MSSPTKYVTKYFEKGARTKILSGSIKFGTLACYRGIEAVEPVGDDSLGRVDLMSDSLEGIGPRVYEVPSGQMSGTIKTSGVIFTGCSFGDVKIATYPTINEWVFCSTEGSYSESHHEVMLRHNPQLTDYCVFDLDKLIAALKDYFWANYFTIRYGANNVPFLLGGVVTYGNKYANYTPPADWDLTREAITQEEYERTIFLKPTKFRHEREFRIAARLNLPGWALASASPVFPASEAIRQSIVDPAKP